MRNKLLSIVALITLTGSLVLPVNVFAADDGEESTPLHAAMETMGKTFRNLGRGLRDPDPAAKDDYLKWLQTIEAAAVEAKQYVPHHVMELPAAEQPAMIAQFRSDLAAAIETMLKLERAIIADDWAAVKTLGRELGAQRGAGHKKYNPEDDK